MALMLALALGLAGCVTHYYPAPQPAAFAGAPPVESDSASAKVGSRSESQASGGVDGSSGTGAAGAPAPSGRAPTEAIAPGIDGVTVSTVTHAAGDYRWWSLDHFYPGYGWGWGWNWGFSSGFPPRRICGWSDWCPWYAGWAWRPWHVQPWYFAPWNVRPWYYRPVHYADRPAHPDPGYATGPRYPGSAHPGPGHPVEVPRPPPPDGSLVRYLPGGGTPGNPDPGLTGPGGRQAGPGAPTQGDGAAEPVGNVGAAAPPSTLSPGRVWTPASRTEPVEDRLGDYAAAIRSPVVTGAPANLKPAPVRIRPDQVVSRKGDPPPPASIPDGKLKSKPSAARPAGNLRGIPLPNARIIVTRPVTRSAPGSALPARASGGTAVRGSNPATMPRATPRAIQPSKRIHPGVGAYRAAPRKPAPRAAVPRPNVPRGVSGPGKGYKSRKD